MFRCRLSQKGLKGWDLLLLSMESIAEVVIVSEKGCAPVVKFLSLMFFLLSVVAVPVSSSKPV